MSKTYSNIMESIIDIPRKDYSRSIFDKFNTNKPVLKKHIKGTIERQIEKLSKIAPVKEYNLIGSILTKQYRKDADLDVDVLFDVPVTERPAVHDKLKKAVKEINGKNITGTKHPINYFPMVDPKVFKHHTNSADDAYDIKNSKFIFMSDYIPLDTTQYMDQFKNKVYKLDIAKGEFVRDLIDFKELDELDDDDISNLSSAVSSKLKEIEQDMKIIIDTGRDVVSSRRDVFTKNMNPQEIKKYGKHNKLPKNVIYKMLEKYYYIKLYKDLKNILGDDGTLSKKEAKKLKSFADYPFSSGDSSPEDS